MKRFGTAIRLTVAAAALAAPLAITSAISTPNAFASTSAKTATEIQANPAIVSISPLHLYLFYFTAKLEQATGSKPGIYKQKVSFYTSAGLACIAPTNIKGIASCDLLLALGPDVGVILSGGFTAKYAGSALYLASSAKGGLIG